LNTFLAYIISYYSIVKVQFRCQPAKDALEIFKGIIRPFTLFYFLDKATRLTAGPKQACDENFLYVSKLNKITKYAFPLFVAT